MADEIKQDQDAQNPTPADASTQPELSGADEQQHPEPAAGADAPAAEPGPDAADVNGAAPQPEPELGAENATTAQPAPVDSPAPEAAGVENASDASGAPVEVTAADPAAALPSDSQPAEAAGDQAGLENYSAIEPEPAAEPMVAGDAAGQPAADAAVSAGDEIVPAAGAEPTAEPAAEPASTEGEQPADAEPAAPADAQPTEASAAPVLPEPAADASPAADAPAAGDAQPEDGASAGAGGDVELPFNSVGMAQLGVAGQESGGPIEHPIPASVPRPADPITGQEVNDEAHAQLTGGLGKGDEVAQPDPSGLAVAADTKGDPAATSDVLPTDDNGLLQHPAPALVPRPVVQGSSQELGQDDHAAVTGGLAKGDEAPQPEGAPKASDDQGEQATQALAPQPGAGSFLGSLDDDEDEDDEGLDNQADEDLIERIRAMLHSELGRVMDKFKHLEHDIKSLRRKR